MKLGFIGLGNLGTPIAMNLLESGHQLNIYNRTVSKTTSLAKRGAVVSESVADLAANCDIVFTMVSDDAALKNICLDNKLLEKLRPGAIHISMSTILPQTALELFHLHNQRQQHYIAAAVFGRPEAAVAKKLNFAVSGEEELRKNIEPLLKDAGAMNVWHFGNEVNTANSVKLCGNFLIASAMEAMGESINLAKNSGVDVQQMWSMFTQTLFNAPVYVNYGNLIIQQKFKPAAFSLKLGLKDVNLVLEHGRTINQPMPLAQLLKSNMDRMVDRGLGDLDWSAIGMANKPASDSVA